MLACFAAFFRFPNPVVELPQPISPELQALEAARDASARITESIPGIQKASMRKRVTSIVTQIDKMLNVIEEDGNEKEEKLAAAPLYESRLVRLFETSLRDDLKLRVRGVEMADSSHQHFETVVLPRLEKAAKEFYQRYHQSDVINLAALLEILKYNLDSIDDDSMNGDD